MHIKSIFILILAIGIFGCGDEKYPTVESVVYANVNYLNKEDMTGYMSTIDPQSGDYNRTEELLNQLFSQYDLNYKIEKLKVTQIDESSATAEFTQLTTKLKGPEFKNNRITGIHNLKFRNGSWKISSTKVISTNYIR